MQKEHKKKVFVLEAQTTASVCIWVYICECEREDDVSILRIMRSIIW